LASAARARSPMNGTVVGANFSVEITIGGDVAGGDAAACLVGVGVDIDAGVIAPKHSHPGEEIVYVIEGILEYSLEGKAPVRLKAGEVLFIPAGVIHSAKNVGKVKGSELATYIVEKEKPLVTYLK